MPLRAARHPAVVHRVRNRGHRRVHDLRVLLRRTPTIAPCSSSSCSRAATSRRSSAALGVSYPTARARVDAMIDRLGLRSEERRRLETLEALARGEIDVDAAMAVARRVRLRGQAATCVASGASLIRSSQRPGRPRARAPGAGHCAPIDEPARDAAEQRRCGVGRSRGSRRRAVRHARTRAAATSAGSSTWISGSISTPAGSAFSAALSARFHGRRWRPSSASPRGAGVLSAVGVVQRAGGVAARRSHAASRSPARRACARPRGRRAPRASRRSRRRSCPPGRRARSRQARARPGMARRAAVARPCSRAVTRPGLPRSVEPTHDHARRPVAGERVQALWHRGVGDHARLDGQYVAQAAQCGLDPLRSCLRRPWSGSAHPRARTETAITSAPVSSAIASASSTGARSSREGS